MKYLLAVSAGIITSTVLVTPDMSENLAKNNIKVTDLKYAIMENSLVIRITTNKEISVYEPVEWAKP